MSPCSGRSPRRPPRSRSSLRIAPPARRAPGRSRQTGPQPPSTVPPRPQHRARTPRVTPLRARRPRRGTLPGTLAEPRLIYGPGYFGINDGRRAPRPLPSRLIIFQVSTWDLRGDLRLRSKVGKLGSLFKPGGKCTACCSPQLRPRIDPGPRGALPGRGGEPGRGL